ncbi:MAG: hypothetical protein IPG50_18150 [Myxococcales bacterium]|nr:hypothetical protein [Myxococcales bacterium]
MPSPARADVWLLFSLLVACGGRSRLGELDDPAGSTSPGPASATGAEDVKTTAPTAASASAAPPAPSPPPQVCRDGARERVDQANVTKQNSVRFWGSPFESGPGGFGQTFRPTQDGALTAIEIAIYRCGDEADGRLRLQVFEGRGVDGPRLATSELRAPAATDCEITVYLPLLHPSQRGPSTFDLTASCAAVRAEHDYTFIVERVDDTHFLTGGTGPTGIGALYDSYPRGAALSYFDGFWNINASNIGGDETFKIYVQP